MEDHADTFAKGKLEPAELAKVYFYKTPDTSDPNPVIQKVRKDSALPQILETLAEAYSPLKSKLL